MDSFIDLAKSRHSTRSFCDKKVEQEKIDLILKAAQVAPTACNFQPFKIYVIESFEALNKLQKCKTSHFNETLAFLITYDKDSCYKRDYDNKESGDIDCSIVATHMMLMAEELNIGSTWIMHFIPEAIKEEFDLKENEEPVVLLAMGYASENAVINPKHNMCKKIEELVKYL